MFTIIDILFSLLILYLMGWVAWKLLSIPGRAYRRRRQAHYEANPDPLFGSVDE